MTLKHALDAFAGAEVAGQLLDTAGGRPGGGGWARGRRPRGPPPRHDLAPQPARAAGDLAAVMAWRSSTSGRAPFVVMTRPTAGGVQASRRSRCQPPGTRGHSPTATCRARPRRRHQGDAARSGTSPTSDATVRERRSMPASRSVVSVLLRELGDSLHPPEPALRAASGPAAARRLSGELASPSTPG
jgi:hypothetical protein